MKRMAYTEGTVKKIEGNENKSEDLSILMNSGLQQCYNADIKLGGL